MKYIKLIIFIAFMTGIAGFFINNMIWMSDVENKYTSSPQSEQNEINDNRSKNNITAFKGTRYIDDEAEIHLPNQLNNEIRSFHDEDEKYIDIELAKEPVPHMKRPIRDENLSSDNYTESLSLQLNNNGRQSSRTETHTERRRREIISSPPKTIESINNNLNNNRQHPTSTGQR